MKKIGILLLIICFLLQSYLVSVNGTELENTAETTPSTTETQTPDNFAILGSSYGLDATIPLLGTDELVNNVRSAIVFEANSQTLMYAFNADTKMFPASLVKIMTALLAVEKGTLEDIVTVTQSAVSSIPYDAVSAKLAVGEKLSLEDLLYCLLLGSANDAATVIAEHISGSQSAFVAEMNRYAQELGCTTTQFTNPHGLHDDDQYTSARDSAKILDAALRNSAFKTLFTADAYTVPATNLFEARKLTTGNAMMDSGNKTYYDIRVIGGRTGVTQDGRRCLASAAESNGMLILSIVMGSESVYKEDGYSAISIGGYKETKKLINACLDGYKAAQILRAEQIMRQIPIDGAQNDLLIAPQTSVYTVLPLNITVDELTLQYADKDIVLPVEKGQHVSDVYILYGATHVAQAQLFAMNTVRPAENGQAVESATGHSVPTVIWIILGIAIGIVIMYLFIRFSNRIKSFVNRIHIMRYRKSHKRTK